MEQEIKNIIITQNFSALSQKELDLIEEWCTNEEEFDALKYMLSEVEGIVSEEKIVASPKTKVSLDKLFEAKHKKRGGIIYQMYPRDKHLVQRPLVQLAAACLLFFIALPFFQNESQMISEPAQIAELKVENKESKEKALKFIAPNEVQEEKQSNGIVKAPETREFKNLDRFDEVSREESFIAMDSELEMSEDAMTAPVLLKSESNMSNHAVSSSIPKHSDIGFDSNEEKINYSISVKANRNVLDLLTASF
jgi:hypothetical protein